MELWAFAVAYQTVVSRARPEQSCPRCNADWGWMVEATVATLGE